VTLLSRLFVLVAVALLPAIAIQAYNELELRRDRRVEVQTDALNVAKLAAAEQQQVVQGIHQVLIALSELPAIKAGDSKACNAYLAGMKQRFPEFLTFIVTDLNGVATCTSRTGHVILDVSSRAYFVSAAKTGAFSVGVYSTGLSIPRKVIQFALPYYGYDGRMRGVIIAPLQLAWLADHLARKGAPEGAALAITDREGTYLARYPDNSRFAGRKMPDWSNPQVRHLDTADVADIDGVERIVGYAALPDESGGLLVSFGLDKALAFTEMRYRTQRGILLIFLSTSLVLALTWIGATRFIHRPLGQLVDAANEWRLGRYTRRVRIRGNDEIGRVAAAFNAMADALEHREQELSAAKEAAEQAAVRITTVFESTTDGVVIADREGRINYGNGPALNKFAEVRGLIGTTVADLFSGNPEFIDRIERSVSDQRQVSFEMFWERTRIWYAVNVFPNPQGIAIHFRDITEHKQAVETRRAITEQLHQSQKMESVGQLTGGVAHDFNNLLAVASGNLELIEVAADNDKVRQFAAAARRAVDGGSRLTAQLLAFSRRQRLNPKRVNATELIFEFQELLRQAIGGGGCQIGLQLDERLWLCHVDPQLLETALLNLALNARDAMPDGGVLTIETKNVDLEEGVVADCAAGTYVRICVTDTGGGMSPEVRARAFEPFFTTKAVGKGTGLGLSMVYGFVRQSGGHVAIDSASGKGTSVALYLPKVAQQPDADVEPLQSQPIQGRLERIFVVEDNKELLELTSQMLVESGYRVVCARSGAEAMEIMRGGQEFELLLSDVVMPNGMNGVELAREVRRMHRGIKVLLTSGYAGGTLERHGADGEFPIIDKPYRLTELAQRLRAILDQA
jgi:signal transduction histidine kinase